MSNKMRIGVVLVTRNRLEKLKITLDLYEKQTKRPEYIIVVDNCSTDSVTGGYLDEWSEIKTDYKKIVIHSEVNGGEAEDSILQKKRHSNKLLNGFGMLMMMRILTRMHWKKSLMLMKG